MDAETLPFQVNLGYQVPRTKEADYIGKAALEEARDQIEAGHPPFTLTMVGLRLGGKPIDEYAPDFWLVRADRGRRPGRLRDLALVLPRARDQHRHGLRAGRAVRRSTPSCAVHLPDRYADTPGVPVDARWSRCRSARRSTPTSASCSGSGASTPPSDAVDRVQGPPAEEAYAAEHTDRGRA